MLIRRCAVLFVEPREDLDIDWSSLFAGESALGATVRWIALAPHLGLPLPQLRSDRAHALLRYYVAEQDGELVTAAEDRRHHTAHSDVQYRRMRAPGERIRLSHSNKDYLGVLSALASDAQALEQAVVHAEAGLQWRIDSAELRA